VRVQEVVLVQGDVQDGAVAAHLGLLDEEVCRPGERAVEVLDVYLERVRLVLRREVFLRDSQDDGADVAAVGD
jgi:hypothetical protein